MKTSIYHKIVVIGHVDHGKSTLLGRLMIDSGVIQQEKIDKVTKICKEKQIDFEPAFIFDALAEEQDQGVTIDTTRVIFEYAQEKYCLIDVPGHLEFLKNMITGASEATNGILIVDIEEGIKDQTRRHLAVLALLGIENVLIVVNKMDKVNYTSTTFENLSAELTKLLKMYNLNFHDLIPVSALHDENIMSVSHKMKWYQGLSFIDSLKKLVQSYKANLSNTLRIGLQDVYKLNDKRYFVGKVFSGQIKLNDKIMFFPSGKESVVKSIETYPVKQIDYAYVNESVALCLTDQIFVERGEIIALAQNAPFVDNLFSANLAWLVCEPMDAHKKYLFKLGFTSTYAKINYLPDKIISLGDIELVDLELDKSIAFDLNSANTHLANFVLCDEYRTVACGNIMNVITGSKSKELNCNNVFKEISLIDRLDRQLAYNHQACVIWLTGLSGSGKSTLARNLELTLFQRSIKTVVLDADNLRLGLCSDLGFSKEDRSENNRRIAHVANMFKEAGFIVIVACIAPYIKDRLMAKTIIGESDFWEIHVFCPLEICQLRDPKGLYKQSQSANTMTGIKSPYQIPVQPNLRLDTSELSLEDETNAIMKLLIEKQIINSREVLTGAKEF